MKKIITLLSLLLCQLAVTAQIGADGYNPENPPGPGEDGDTVQYVVLHLVSDPTNGGAFAWGLGAQSEYFYKVEPGKTYTATSYPATGFDFSHWTVDDVTVGRDMKYTFTCPDHDFEIVCHYTYNPENPANPGKNFWNGETGDLILTDFKPGRLYDALRDAMPIYNASPDFKALRAVIVVGICAQDFDSDDPYSDWSAFRYFPNVASIDMSRTNGLDFIREGQFQNNKVLTSISLPATTARIGERAFAGCGNLQKLACHATTPPLLGQDVFQGVGNLIVQVPAESMGLYAAADGWKDLTLVPLVEQVSRLTLTLPLTTNMDVYRDMRLELVNLQTGQAKRYILTDRKDYTFNNLLHNTAYNAYVRTQNGGIVGRIDTIAIIDHDVQATFPDLKRPVTVTLQLSDPQGNQLPSLGEGQGVACTWTDTRGNYIAKGLTLPGQVERDSVRYSISLGEALGTRYQQPADSTYRITGEGIIRLSLEPLRQVTLSGLVSSETTGQPLRGASVAVVQRLNGRYPTTQTVQTDGDGRWSMTVYDAPTTVTMQAAGYLARTDTLRSLPPGGRVEGALPDLTGTIVNLDLYYRPSLADGEENTSADDYFDNPSDVSYSVCDITHHPSPITQISEQFPLLVLTDSVRAPGTQLRITATSKTGTFMPVEVICRVDSTGHALATIGITQLGILEASFTSTDNQVVMGAVYDSNGRLVGNARYNGTTLTVGTLPDGDYTLITMGYSSIVTAAPTLEALRQMGLTARHIVENPVNIKSGHVTKVSNATIPLMDDSEFSYTGEQTRFSANKTHVVVGQYVTLRTQLDFKAAYAAELDDVSMVYDLPEGCQLVEGSIMVGNSISGDYTVKDRQVIVPLPQATDVVRFCVVPTASGQQLPTATVTFTFNGQQRQQPIGTAPFDAEDMTIDMLTVTANGHLPVNGMAPANAQVDIYDGEALIGHTQALLSGAWSATVDLVRPYNMSQHEVYAVITTPDGHTMQTAKTVVRVDFTELMPVVDMSFYNNLHFLTEHVIWDFRTSTVNKQSYGWPLDHSSLPVTFEINFMSADKVVNDTARIPQVKLGIELDNGAQVLLPARFNTKKGCWMVERDIDTDALPNNVWVEWNITGSTTVSRAQLDDIESDIMLGYKEGQQMYLDAQKDFDLSGVEAEHAKEFEALDALYDIAEPTQSDLQRRDSLVRIIVGNDLMDEARRKYQVDYTEIDAALARNRENPDAEEVLQLTEKLLAMTNGVLNEEQDLQSEIAALKQEIATLEQEEKLTEEMRQRMYDNTMDMLSLCYAGYDDDVSEMPTGDMEFVVPGDSVDRYYTQKTLAAVDTAQLKRDGYLEYDTDDGYKLYVLQEGGHYCIIDTKTMLKREMEIKEGTGAALARMNGKIIHDGGIGTPKAFISKECIRTFTVLPTQFVSIGEKMKQSIGMMEQFRIALAEAKSLRDKLDEALKCMYNEGMASLDREIKEKYGANATREAKERIAKEETNIERYRKKLAEKEARLTRLQQSYPRLKESEKVLQECLKTAQSPEMARRLEADLESVRNAIQKIDRVADETKGFAKSCNFIIKGFETEIGKIKNLLKGVLKNKAPIEALFEQIPKSIEAIKASGSFAIKGSGFLAKVFGTVIGAFFQIAPLVILVQDNFKDIFEWSELVDIVKSYDPCIGDEDNWAALYSQVKTDCTWHSGIDIAQIGADAASLLIDVFDLPLAPHWFVSLAIDIASITTSFVHPNISNQDKQNIRNWISRLKCVPPDPEPPVTDWEVPDGTLGGWNRQVHGTANLDRAVKLQRHLESKPTRDPSGYVYEGVSSNRLEGVTATCYYKEEVEDMYGDLYERTVVWDAENYEQVNPQLTDVEGKYGWDVPRGLWQVKFEKQGYETAYSEWLPVPPPQLDVNIGMTQLRQPEVKRVTAYKNAIEVEFDKFMDPATLTRQNISVTKGGEALGGTLQLMNADEGYQKPGVRLASKVAFLPLSTDLSPLAQGDKVVLTVSRRVESYAGLQMESDFQQEFTVMSDTLPVERDTTQVDSTMMKVEVPTATRISGTTVSRGATVELRCKTEGATIWYTTDGSCPCDENGTRRQYTGAITINDHLVLKAYAVKGVMQESDIVSFEYFVQEEVATTAISASGAGWCTFYDSQVNYRLPSGLKAYVVTADNNQQGGIRYVELTDGIVPKATAVAIENTAHTAGTFTLTSVSEAAPYNGENLLNGSDEATTTTALVSSYFYKACYGPAGTALEKWFGWYPANKEKGAFRSEAHRAWLAIPKGSASRSFYGFADGVAEIVNSQLSNSKWFDLQGRRVEKPRAKGIYIKDKQKMISDK